MTFTGVQRAVDAEERLVHRSYRSFCPLVCPFKRLSLQTSHGESLSLLTTNKQPYMG